MVTGSYKILSQILQNDGSYLVQVELEFGGLSGETIHKVISLTIPPNTLNANGYLLTQIQSLMNPTPAASNPLNLTLTGGF